MPAVHAGGDPPLTDHNCASEGRGLSSVRRFAGYQLALSTKARSQLGVRYSARTPSQFTSLPGANEKPAYHLIVNHFPDALAAIQRMKAERVVDEYAIGGAMAMAFWSEPVPTFDLDVFALMPSTSLLVSLAPIYEWARENGFREEAEHILIAGVPVQIIPAHSPLAEEAVRKAASLDYEGIAVRVMRPEYLIALCLEPSTRTAKRLQRVATLVEEPSVDHVLLMDIVARYKLKLPSYD